MAEVAMTLTIRPARPETDSGRIWAIFRAVIREGETYVFEDSMTREEALACWFGAGTFSYVAVRRDQTEDGAEEVLGTCIFRANQPGRGSHVANASFMVAEAARGLGVGTLMGQHVLTEAAARGFTAMQFNMVVSTNESAVRLWTRLGFAVAGVIPGGFRHARLGMVDALVMHRRLDPPAA